jgi:hypothetical protein
VYPGDDGHLVYVSDDQGNTIPDFSNVGYMSGTVPLPGTEGTPNVPVRITLDPAPGDAGARIQAAIDFVSSLPIRPDGFRGAVLLRAGEYQIADHVEIRTSGVVLRGEGIGAGGTILRATGTARRYDDLDPRNDGLVQLRGDIPTSISLRGSAAPPRFPGAPGRDHAIVDPYVPVGARSFTVSDTTGLSIGDPVIVHRPSPANWIHDLGMDAFGSQSWQPNRMNLDSDRIITQIDGNQITIDAPLTNALDQQYGGGTVYKYTFPGRIDHVGVQYVRGDSDFQSSTDEDHAWTFISLIGVENAFVRHVAAYHFAFSAVDVHKTAKWVTVQDAYYRDPISRIQGGRRYSFNVDGQLTLVRDAHARQGRHDFVQGSIVPGPNVFVDCTGEQSFDESGPHTRWSTGTLFDNVRISAASVPDPHHRIGALNAHNRGQDTSGSLQGWAGANMVIWNSSAHSVEVEQPPTAQNWAIGAVADNTPLPSSDGYYDSFGTPVEPRSLYGAQLQERLGRPGPARPGRTSPQVSASALDEQVSRFLTGPENAVPALGQQPSHGENGKGMDCPPWPSFAPAPQQSLRLMNSRPSALSTDLLAADQLFTGEI